MREVLVILSLLLASNSFASLTPPFIVESDGHTQTNLQSAVSEIDKGSIVLLGELHHNPDHHHNQLTIIHALIANGHKVHLGMEFLNYTDQYTIYQYQSGLITEGEFLEKVEWGDPETFKFYSPLIHKIFEHQGSLIGLNIPRPITSSVAKNGVDSLTTSEKELLPNPLALGSDFYFERFYQAVGGTHFPEDKLQNYFWAQSIWDDVMSWQAIEFMERSPEDTLVVIVGDFHVSYGGGLPNLLERKGFSKVISVSQTVKSELSDDELIQELTPHADYGPRADWIWVTK